jgi:hypothetical protein
MIEDTPSGLAFAADWGCPPEELPQDVEQLSEAQYAVHQFMTVLRAMNDPLAAARVQAEVQSKIVLPT